MSGTSATQIGYTNTIKTYRPPFDPEFPLLFGIGYERTNEVFANEDYLRIGDSAFHIPPQNIVVREIANSTAESVLRTPGGIVMSDGFVEKEITIELVFTSALEIFGVEPSYTDITVASRSVPKTNYIISPPIIPSSLAALIAQFKRTPIVPVINKFLNYSHDVKAAALQAIRVDTELDEQGQPVPNMLRATLIMTAFAFETLMPTIIDFDTAWIWPIARWHWRQAYTTSLPGQYSVYAKGTDPPQFPVLNPDEINSLTGVTSPTQISSFPRYSHMSGLSANFQFLGISSDWINTLNGLREEFNKLQAYVLSNTWRTSTNTAQKTADTQSLNSLLNEITTLTRESGARLEPIDMGLPGDLILVHMSLSMANNFAKQRAPQVETPIYQHMAQSEVRITATFWANSDAALNQIRHMIRDSRKLARDVRFQMIGGFIGFENELSSMFGVHAVVFADVQSRTIESTPGRYLITVEMVSFDRNQRRIEELKQANGNPDAIVPQYVGHLGNDFQDQTDPRIIFWNRHLPNTLTTKGLQQDPQQPSASDVPTTSMAGIMADAAAAAAIQSNAAASSFEDASIVQQQQTSPTPNPTAGAAPPQIDPNTGLFTSAPNTGPVTTGTTAIGYDEDGRPTNAWFNGAYIQEAKEQMAFLELYPDLMLPTYQRLLYAIQNEIFSNATEAAVQAKLQQLRWEHWYGKGRYVDPDFYMDYPNSKLASQYQSMSSATGITSTLSVAAALIGSIGNNPIIVNSIDGSLRNSITDSLFDNYPQTGAYFGPSLQLYDAGQAAGDSAYPRGNDQIHASVNFPNPSTTKSAVIQPSFQHPGYTEDVTIDGILVPNAELPAATAYPYNPTQFVSKYPDITKQAHGVNQADPQFLAPGSDPRPSLSQAIMAHHPVDIGGGIPDEHTRLIAMFNDLLENDVSGRLVQAYPSYVFQLIDEGPRLGWFKLFSNFFALQSIQSIDVLQDRRDPIHTCIVEIMNTYGNLSNYTQFNLNADAAVDLVEGRGSVLEQWSTVNTNDISTDIQMLWDGIWQPIRNLLVTPDLANAANKLRRQQNQSVMLQPGTRIHVRMGYGSNGAKLPVVFNGRVVDIGHGERIEMIAQGDGVELSKLIPGADSESNSINAPTLGSVSQFKGVVVDGHPAWSMLSSTYEPREIICQMLGSHGIDLFDYSLSTEFWNAVKTNIYQSTNGALFFDNPIGICHFGNPYLFSFWDAYLGPGLEQLSKYNDPTVPGVLSSYAKAVAAVTTADQSWANMLVSISTAIANGDTKMGIGALGTLLTNNISPKNSALLIAGPPLPTASLGLTPFNQMVAGLNANMLNHEIRMGYGEVGENVYSIYSPFLGIYQNAGSLFSKAGQAFATAGIAAGQAWVDGTAPNLVGTMAAFNSLGNAYDGAFSGSPGLPDIGATPDVGAPPGIAFNMYTHNKTVWDIISTMSQFYPPYVAAVRPFEYRSTLFFGAPYWQYRYDYRRIGAADLGARSSGDLDLFYGYPVAYKVKTFAQFHIYNTLTNLLDNNIRASDEDTFTDVIAMWYSGQGFTKSRPVPIPIKQTVDRAIGEAFRKTSIVNTDILGIDNAPTFSAIIQSAGLDLIPYFVVHVGNIALGSLLNKPGVMDTWQTEESMRWMARSMLRDYQKLMYQGNILVLGDPTAKPFDWMYIHDDYVDIDGPAQIRKVVHHLSIDRGFVTSIEPDLFVEVKGENMFTSLATWCVGYVAANVVARTSSKIVAAIAKRNFLRACGNFGLKLLGKNALIAGQAIDRYEPRFLLYSMRKIFLDSIGSLLGSSPAMSAESQVSYTDMVKDLSNAMNVERHMLGDDAVTQTAKEKLFSIIDKYGADVLDNEGRMILNEAFAKNVLLKGVEKLDAAFINRIASTYFLQRFGAKILLKANWITRIGTVVSAAQSALGKAIAGTAAEAAVTSITEDLAELAAKGAVTEAVAALRVGLTAALTSVEFFIGVAVPFGLGLLIDIGIQFLVGLAFTSYSRWIDDETSLQMMFLRYRGDELQAGLNGHSETIVFQASKQGDLNAQLSALELKNMKDNKVISLRRLYEKMLVANAGPGAQPGGGTPIAGGIVAPPTASEGTGLPTGSFGGPITPLQGKFNTAQKKSILAKHYPANVQIIDQIVNGQMGDAIIGFLQYLTSQGVSVYISSAYRTGSARHASGEAIDIAGAGPSGTYPGIGTIGSTDVVPTGNAGSPPGFVDGATNLYQTQVLAAALNYYYVTGIGISNNAYWAQFKFNPQGTTEQADGNYPRTLPPGISGATRIEIFTEGPWSESTGSHIHVDCANLYL